MMQHTFELSLQGLGDVVGDFERLLLAHDNVDFNVVLLSRMVGAAGIDLLDPVVMGDDEVDQLADEVLGCRLANKQPDVVKGIGRPRDKDQETNENGTDGIDIPDDAAADNRHGKTECIDDNVVAVINEEDMHCGVPAEDETIDTERTFAEDCCGDKGNGDNVQFFRL